ncbi:hypothetical protein Tco_0526228, partial [Tanacetum coccineum]
IQHEYVDAVARPFLMDVIYCWSKDFISRRVRFLPTEITHDLCPVTEENNKTECKGVLTDSPTDFRLDSLDARMHMVVSKVGLAGLFAIVLNISFPNKKEES